VRPRLQSLATSPLLFRRAPSTTHICTCRPDAREPRPAVAVLVGLLPCRAAALFRNMDTPPPVLRTPARNPGCMQLTKPPPGRFCRTLPPGGCGRTLWRSGKTWRGVKPGALLRPGWTVDEIPSGVDGKRNTVHSGSLSFLGSDLFGHDQLNRRPSRLCSHERWPRPASSSP
jgi:hypothetical protein